MLLTTDSWQIRVPYLITKLLLFIKSQFRTNAQNRTTVQSMNAWTSLITDCRTLSKVWGGLRMVWQLSKARWWSEFSFSSEAEFVTVLRNPKTKNLKDLGLANVGAVPRKVGVCGQILIETLFFVLACKTHSRSLSKHFQYTLSSRYKVSLWLKRYWLNLQLMKFAQATLTKPATHEVGSRDTD
jgi:hypothetical protein